MIESLLVFLILKKCCLLYVGSTVDQDYVLPTLYSSFENMTLEVLRVMIYFYRLIGRYLQQLVLHLMVLIKQMAPSLIDLNLINDVWGCCTKYCF